MRLGQLGGWENDGEDDVADDADDEDDRGDDDGDISLSNRKSPETDVLNPDMQKRLAQHE